MNIELPVEILLYKLLSREHSKQKTDIYHNPKSKIRNPKSELELKQISNSDIPSETRKWFHITFYSLGCLEEK